MMSRKLTLVAVALALLTGGCASERYLAISAHCNTEGFSHAPPLNRMVRQVTLVHVGDKIVGTKEVCTVTESQGLDYSGDVVSTRQRVCRHEQITEPAFEPREIDVVVDVNQQSRNRFVDSCVSDAFAKNMYSDLD
jgi:hypothetical protein